MRVTTHPTGAVADAELRRGFGGLQQIRYLAVKWCVWITRVGVLVYDCAYVDAHPRGWWCVVWI